MRTVLIGPQAHADLNGIWEFIARSSVDAADRVRDTIRREITKLAETPGIGHTRNDVKEPSFRFWSVYSYLIVYRYDDDILAVVRIVHGARNLRRLLQRRR